MIEPVSDALTTSISPAWRAKNAMISSAMLPNVALRIPPTCGPGARPDPLGRHPDEPGQPEDGQRRHDEDDRPVGVEPEVEDDRERRGREGDQDDGPGDRRELAEDGDRAAGGRVVHRRASYRLARRERAVAGTPGGPSDRAGHRRVRTRRPPRASRTGDAGRGPWPGRPAARRRPGRSHPPRAARPPLAPRRAGPDPRSGRSPGRPGPRLRLRIGRSAGDPAPPPRARTPRVARSPPTGRARRESPSVSRTIVFVELRQLAADGPGTIRAAGSRRGRARVAAVATRRLVDDAAALVGGDPGQPLAAARAAPGQEPLERPARSGHPARGHGREDRRGARDRDDRAALRRPRPGPAPRPDRSRPASRRRSRGRGRRRPAGGRGARAGGRPRSGRGSSRGAS